MQGGSGDSRNTQFTLNDNPAAPAEEINQSSPGDTAESGGLRSTRTTRSGWQNVTSRRRISTQSTPRSSRNSARSEGVRQGHRSTRGRTTPRDHSARADRDRVGERTGDSRVKRRSTDTSVASEPVVLLEELRAQCHTLRSQLINMEAYAASRDQLIRDIEVKFTGYLREHNQNVFEEVSALNHRLTCSINEVAEYHAELMVASQEDEGATRRIEELERRGALMEHGARRIYERGMEIQGECKDEVHHLQGLLGNTEVRLQELHQTNVLTTDVANRLYTEGQEMQSDFQNSIVEFRNRSELASSSNTHLEMVSQQQSIAVHELSEQNRLLGEALVQSRKQAELYENSMEEITRESRKKVYEANQAKLESELRHRTTEHDTVRRITSYRNTEAEAISHLRLESQASANAVAKAEHYEELYVNEQKMNCELKDEIKFQNEKLRKSLTQGSTTIGRGPSEALVEDLRNQAKIAQIRVQDLGHEVHEYLQENMLLREKLSEVSDVRTSSFSNTEVQALKSELDSERKSKLASGAQHYERSCAFMGELQDRDEKIGIRNSEIIDMKRHIDELRKDLKSSEKSLSRVNPNDLPYSAGLTNHDLASRLVIDKLENEVNEVNSENNVLRSWVSQVDKELNHETNVALYYRGRSDPSQGPPSKQNKKITDLLKEVDSKIADGTEKDYYQNPGGGGGLPDPNDPSGPFGPNNPGPPPDPPGLPSLRGSQRDSVDDISTAAYTAEEAPRISRREADKVFISPWPKQQNLGVWQSDLVKSVVLAANDGDRAAWEAWLQHAIRPNPDLELLNDSGGQRYQSIDAKLSIALSNVISQAGDVARHVAIKLRLRTQNHSRRGTYVMGREILAMILEHFRTPGQRETAFTMEHIVSMKYLGDQS